MHVTLWSVAKVMHRQNELGKPCTAPVLASLVLASCLLAVAACGGGNDAAPMPAAAVGAAGGSVAVETGGMALPSSGTPDAQPQATAEAAGVAAEAPSAVDAAPETASEANSGTGAAPEQEATAGAASASPEGEAVGGQPASEAPPALSATPVLEEGSTITAAASVTLYADAVEASPRFGVYDAGTVLTVVEAGGDYAAYPVEVDGARWYRVRAPDGLVGWVQE
jgi:hypothetical protein